MSGEGGPGPAPPQRGRASDALTFYTSRSHGAANSRNAGPESESPDGRTEVRKSSPRSPLEVSNSQQWGAYCLLQGGVQPAPALSGHPRHGVRQRRKTTATTHRSGARQRFQILVTSALSARERQEGRHSGKGEANPGRSRKGDRGRGVQGGAPESRLALLAFGPDEARGMD